MTKYNRGMTKCIMDKYQWLTPIGKNQNQTGVFLNMCSTSEFCI